jgi:hypothetical protein
MLISPSPRSQVELRPSNPDGMRRAFCCGSAPVLPSIASAFVAEASQYGNGLSFKKPFSAW